MRVCMVCCVWPTHRPHTGCPGMPRCWPVEESTSSRIAWSTLLETTVLLSVTGLQIMYLRRIVNNAAGWV